MTHRETSSLDCILPAVHSSRAPVGAGIGYLPLGLVLTHRQTSTTRRRVRRSPCCRLGVTRRQPSTGLHHRNRRAVSARITPQSLTHPYNPRLKYHLPGSTRTRSELSLGPGKRW